MSKIKPTNLVILEIVSIKLHIAQNTKPRKEQHFVQLDKWLNIEWKTDCPM